MILLSCQINFSATAALLTKPINRHLAPQLPCKFVGFTTLIDHFFILNEIPIARICNYFNLLVASLPVLPSSCSIGDLHIIMFVLKVMLVCFVVLGEIVVRLMNLHYFSIAEQIILKILFLPLAKDLPKCRPTCLSF